MVRRGQRFGHCRGMPLHQGTKLRDPALVVAPVPLPQMRTVNRCRGVQGGMAILGSTVPGDRAAGSPTIASALLMAIRCSSKMRLALANSTYASSAARQGARSSSPRPDSARSGSPAHASPARIGAHKMMQVHPQIALEAKHGAIAGRCLRDARGQAASNRIAARPMCKRTKRAGIVNWTKRRTPWLGHRHWRGDRLAERRGEPVEPIQKTARQSGKPAQAPENLGVGQCLLARRGDAPGRQRLFQVRNRREVGRPRSRTCSSCLACSTRLSSVVLSPV